MRLWTLHPCLLDPRGLVALWREGLLAQAVLRGRTRGYTRHPQLRRFQEAEHPLAAIGTFLDEVQTEAARRGYAFDASRVTRSRTTAQIRVTRGQVEHEWRHLEAKLAARAPAWLAEIKPGARHRVHPLFRVVGGPIEPWEVRGA